MTGEHCEHTERRKRYAAPSHTRLLSKRAKQFCEKRDILKNGKRGGPFTNDGGSVKKLTKVDIGGEGGCPLQC